MRFMILVKADENSEAGVLPDEKLLTEMGQYNEELVKAGVLLAAEGIQPSSKGARVRFSGTKRTVVDGPFAETKELIAGFWLIQVKSKEEAIEGRRTRGARPRATRPQTATAWGFRTRPCSSARDQSVCCSSRRPRWSRERTVPSGQSRTEAIA